MWRIIVCGKFGVSNPREILYGWTQPELDAAHEALDFQYRLESPPSD